MIQAAPYLVLGVFATVATVLYIAGCAITKNWYPMFTIFPALLCCVFALILIPMLSSSYETEGCTVFTPDSTIFYLVFFLVGAIGLPCIFYHCNTINKVCFGMHLGGDAAVLVGFIAFLYTSNKVESTDF